jgi:serpin B
MNYYLSIILSVFLLNLTPSCQNGDLTPQVAQVELELTTQQAEKASQNNAFTFDLLTEALSDLSDQENAMLSPLSVTMALSMTANGAEGATQSTIYKTLRSAGYEPSFLNEYYKKLITSLPALDPKVKLDIANSIWYKEGFQVVPAFLETNENFYQATARALNFNDPAATKIINDWVNEKTKGKIPTIVDKIDQDMRMYLINAIYFKGAWSKPFKKDRTQNMEFHSPSGSVQTPFMQNEGVYSVFENVDFKAVEIPYGDTTYSMYAFLPANEISPKTLLNKLSENGKWDEYQREFNSRQTRLSLPKFKFSYENSLIDELEQLGMGLAFSNQADFSGIEKNGGLTISEVKHKTFIEVNEEGTEAAAVTSVGVSLTSMPQYYTLNFDRPFLFFIRENSSGLIMFAGQVNNPGHD